jgi:type III secretory pathway component EscU
VNEIEGRAVVVAAAAAAAAVIVPVLAAVAVVVVVAVVVAVGVVAFAVEDDEVDEASGTRVSTVVKKIASFVRSTSSIGYGV